MKIKNVDKTDHGIATSKGYTIIPAGETIDAEVPTEEVELVGKTGWFSFDGKPAGKPQKLFPDELQPSGDGATEDVEEEFEDVGDGWVEYP